MNKSRKIVLSALLGVAITSGLNFSNFTHSKNVGASPQIPAAGFFTRVATLKVSGASAEIVAATADGPTA